MPFATIPEALDAFRRGEMLVVVDDEDRENEGDLTIAAEFCTPEAINFMAVHGRGLVCLALAPEICDRLNLPLMSQRNTSQFGTAFCEAIDAAEGVTTGISAACLLYTSSVYLWIRYLSLFLFAAASLALYRGRQPFLGAHLIFGLHYYSFDYVLSGAMARVPPEVASQIIVFLGFGYLFLALRRLFGDGFWKTLGKCFLLFTAIGIAEAVMVVGSLLLALRLN